MKRHVILTATDSKYGDFLIDHWFRSLRENVDLTQIDIVVIDYGLSTAQRYYLENHGAICLNGKRDGHVAVIRFRDYNKVLSGSAYDQVLICDSGDMIFQEDISPLFDQHKEDYRAVCEDNKSPFSFFIKDDFFSKEDKSALLDDLLNNKMINAGFLLGPREKMQELCQVCTDKIRNKEKFGPDQLLINMLLHQKGFVELEGGYNFVISSSKDNFFVEQGIFYFDSGRVIPVVHNAGNWKLLRPIENFGYGTRFNTVKYPVYSTLKMVNTTSNNLYGLRSTLFKKKPRPRPFHFPGRKKRKNTRYIDRDRL